MSQNSSLPVTTLIRYFGCAQLFNYIVSILFLLPLNRQQGSLDTNLYLVLLKNFVWSSEDQGLLFRFTDVDNTGNYRYIIIRRKEIFASQFVEYGYIFKLFALQTLELRLCELLQKYKHDVDSTTLRADPLVRIFFCQL